MKNSPILIIGKNGKTGARVNQRLQDLGYTTRAVSRSTNPSFDWENRASWAPVIKGTRSAYVTYQPDLAVPDAEADIKELVKAARENGLEHIVLLSGRGEKGAQLAEKVLQESGISWNIVRCSWFCQNFSESFMLEGILDGELVLPAADTVEPFVDADDIADVAVSLLTDPGHRNKLFELTGPRALNFAQCIKEISEALGRPLKYTTVPIDDYVTSLRKQGVPEELQWLLHELFTVVFDGRNCNVMSGVEEALGRPATDFKTYVKKTIESGVWDVELQKQSA
ncbi:NmrA family transcriptional regulator [Solemya velum gill symbiont]|uniref:NmrA family NAD(P)-binding protein n=1 Tax=Solemya velum gill symbiont TaxID=2340 RepID=UPI000996364B|nr:NmrA family NAD(P)-binding protein [Solemya velum gill symbiont]OOZ19029.1 NmrA family transcriptional regulator [Solemya velum gill symbiont]OOZ28524.1 NmrA family transcriptional regulator [Solemya velum gill symbiont]